MHVPTLSFIWHFNSFSHFIRLELLEIRCSLYPTIDWSVLLLAALIPVGEALQTTAAADLIANGFMKIAGQYSPYLCLACDSGYHYDFVRFIKQCSNGINYGSHCNQNCSVSPSECGFFLNGSCYWCFVFIPNSNCPSEQYHGYGARKIPIF